MDGLYGKKLDADKTPHKIHQKVDNAPMAAVFNLADVFQKVIHTLYHRTLPQQDLIIHVHQYVLHYSTFGQALFFC
jgi:hypothetical protein